MAMQLAIKYTCHIKVFKTISSFNKDTQQLYSNDIRKLYLPKAEKLPTKLYTYLPTIYTF